MIKTTGLTKVYTTTEVETTALRQVNFAVQAGEFVAVMGPSGCGKSTLLHLLGLLDTPSEGIYTLFDQDVSQVSERQRAMLDFAVKVARDSHLLETADFDRLHAHGFSDEDIWDIGAIAALFALSNRMASLLALEPNSEFYSMGRTPP